MNIQESLTVQEKYNQKIVEAKSEDAILNLYHTRSNILYPLGLSKNETVLLVGNDSDAIREYLADKVKATYELKTTSSKTLENTVFEVEKDKYDVIVVLGHLEETMMTLSLGLMTGGRLAVASSTDEMSDILVKKLAAEAGLKLLEEYVAEPDYRFASEIFLKDYKASKSNSYLLVFN